MKPGELLPGVGRPVAFYPIFIQICGSVTAALLLSQLFYWTEKQRDPRGWIYKTAEEWQHELSLTYKQQFTARAALRHGGFLEERRWGSVHRLEFRVCVEAVRRKVISLKTPAETQGGASLQEDGTFLLEAGCFPPEGGTLPMGGSLIGTSREYAETTSESSSREESAPTPAAGEEDSITAHDSCLDIPSTPAQALRHPAIQLFQRVCGRIPGEKQYGSVIETMSYFQHQKGDETVAYLQPFWLAWSSRRRRSDGQPYDPASLAWLTEWAFNGAIPPEAGGNDGLWRRNAGGTSLEERGRPFTPEQLGTIERINAKTREEGLPDLQRDRDVATGSAGRTS